MSLVAALHGLLLHIGTIDMLCCAGGGGEGAGGNGGNSGSGSGSTSLVGDKQNDKKKLAPVSITLVSFAVSRKAYTKVHVPPHTHYRCHPTRQEAFQAVVQWSVPRLCRCCILTFVVLLTLYLGTSAGQLARTQVYWQMPDEQRLCCLTVDSPVCQGVRREDWPSCQV